MSRTSLLSTNSHNISVRRWTRMKLGILHRKNLLISLVLTILTVSLVVAALVANDKSSPTSLIPSIPKLLPLTPLEQPQDIRKNVIIDPIHNYIKRDTVDSNNNDNNNNSDNANNNNNTTNNNQTRGDQFGETTIRNNDFVQYYAVTISGVVTASVSQSSNLYMLYRILTRKEWYNSWNHRFPFYLALQDSLFNINMIGQWIQILSTETFPSSLICKLQGGFLNFTIVWNAMLVTCTAITAYIKVYCQKQVAFGRFDWRFHVVCMSVPIILIGAGIFFDAYGTSTYWCQVNIDSLSGLVDMSVISGIIILCTFITTYCYFKVIRKIKESLTKLEEMRNSRLPAPVMPAVRKPTYSSSIMSSITEKHYTGLMSRGSMVNLRNLATAAAREGVYGWEVEAISKMSTYILVFVFQWGPAVLAYILIFSGYDTIITNLTLVLFIHLGGLFNAMVYLRQHGYFSPKESTLQRSNSTYNLAHYDDSQIFSPPFNDNYSLRRGRSFDSRPRLSNAEIVIQIQTSHFVADSDSERSVQNDSGIESVISKEDELEGLEDFEELEPVTPPETPPDPVTLTEAISEDNVDR